MIRLYFLFASNTPILQHSIYPASAFGDKEDENGKGLLRCSALKAVGKDFCRFNGEGGLQARLPHLRKEVSEGTQGDSVGRDREESPHESEGPVSAQEVC